MSLSIDRFPPLLIKRILAAESETEVEIIIADFMKSLHTQSLAEMDVLQLADKIIKALYIFDPCDFTHNQWTNIHLAKILFNRIKNPILVPAL